jgi:hypothetical protein
LKEKKGEGKNTGGKEEKNVIFARGGRRGGVTDRT